MIKTSWMAATTDINEAIVGLLSCIQNGYNAWIEVRKNGNQDYPVMIPNPELDDPFNWTSAYGMPRNEKELASQHYLNETSKDLAYNWTAVLGTPEAVEEYKKSRKISPELFSGGSVCCPVRIEDANRYRKPIDGYEYGFWMNIWKPKKGIPLYVPDKGIDNVFVVCYETDSEKAPDLKQQLRRAGKFLLDYARRLDKIQNNDSEDDRDPDAVVGERSLDLTISAKKKGYDIQVYDSQTGSNTKISCEDLPSIGKNTHGNSLMEEIQFWVDSIREEACGGEEG